MLMMLKRHQPQLNKLESPPRIQSDAHREADGNRNAEVHC